MAERNTAIYAPGQTSATPEPAETTSLTLPFAPPTGVPTSTDAPTITSQAPSAGLAAERVPATPSLREVYEQFRVPEPVGRPRRGLHVWWRDLSWVQRTLIKAVAVVLFLTAMGVLAAVYPQPERAVPTTSRTASTSATARAATVPPTAAAAPVDVIDYEVVYNLRGVRFDGGRSLYVLIGPVDVSNGAFRDDIRSLVRELTDIYGAMVSIEFHDDRDSLELSYAQYGSGTLGRPRTAAEDAHKARHLVAAFSGVLPTYLYNNTLDFFPGAFTDTPQVGRWVDAVEFNP